MINRPYTTTFTGAFEKAPYNEEALLQVFKLTRNFIASLYIGSGQPRAELEFPDTFDSRLEYLEWVRQWKLAYAQLSVLIRRMRMCRRKVYFDVAYLQSILPAARNKFKNQNLRIDELRDIIESLYSNYEERFKETAQVMLNARYNAKLASIGSKVVNAT